MLVIEIKMKKEEHDCDDKKLELFTKREEYKYCFGLFIGFDKMNLPDLEWYENGKSVT